MAEEAPVCPLCGRTLAARDTDDGVEALGIHFETCQATRSRPVDPLR